MSTVLEPKTLGEIHKSLMMQGDKMLGVPLVAKVVQSNARNEWDATGLAGLVVLTENKEGIRSFRLLDI